MNLLPRSFFEPAEYASPSLDRLGLSWQIVTGMGDSTKLDPTKRHRHDVGDVAHGATSQEEITKGIQGLLGLWVVLTIGLLVFIVFSI